MNPSLIFCGIFAAIFVYILMDHEIRGPALLSIMVWPRKYYGAVNRDLSQFGL